MPAVRFLVAGASGFLGQALSRSLTTSGHHVVALVRRPARDAGEATWDPYAEDPDRALDRRLVEDADVVVNLAGAPLAHWPWTQSYKRTFADSRLVTTRVLAQAVAASDRKPTLVAQNGISGYGDRAAEVITEATPVDGEGFLADLTRHWEAASAPASAAGARVVVLRTAVVLHRSGSALKPMLPIFRLGLGGRLGNGSHYFATISLQDWVSAATYLALNDGSAGAYNVAGPGTTTNAEFTQELGRQLRRPTVLRVPALPLRKLGGVAGNELLSSGRVEPGRLPAEGFAFAHPDLAARLSAALA